MIKMDEDKTAFLDDITEKEIGVFHWCYISVVKVAVDPVQASGHQPILEMYMHDILGGSSPTTRPITGLLVNIYGGQVPFARPTGFLSPQGGVAIPNANGAILTVNDVNEIPLGTGLASTTFSGKQSDQALLTPLSLNGLSLGFGTITVIDDILTTSPEPGSQTIGKAQVYMASLDDGSTQMMAFTAMIEGGEYGDTLNLYGIFKIGSPMSHLFVTRGTGKFKSASGFAEVRSLIPPGQHVIDEAETLLRIIVHLSS
ncbi:dirigent protein 18-like [Pyrus ussuriensis x Pyrus communis]|uniref:Dirigent protein n=1 Tax=Pyrus ussuriensis x Pyrus communis TaxID=2448454 RepID=A0A5N5FFF3_9ROSA|nr:dirigent protein 18-like [Pyrus ussuriensis x Pyrus communis]